MIPETRHTTALIPLTISKMLERMAYYGVRSFLILYLLNGGFGFSEEDMSLCTI